MGIISNKKGARWYQQGAVPVDGTYTYGDHLNENGLRESRSGGSRTPEKRVGREAELKQQCYLDLKHVLQIRLSHETGISEAELSSNAINAEHWRNIQNAVESLQLPELEKLSASAKKCLELATEANRLENQVRNLNAHGHFHRLKAVNSQVDAHGALHRRIQLPSFVREYKARKHVKRGDMARVVDEYAGGKRAPYTYEELTHGLGVAGLVHMNRPVDFLDNLRNVQSLDGHMVHRHQRDQIEFEKLADKYDSAWRHILQALQAVGSFQRAVHTQGLERIRKAVNEVDKGTNVAQLDARTKHIKDAMMRAGKSSESDFNDLTRESHELKDKMKLGVARDIVNHIIEAKDKPALVEPNAFAQWMRENAVFNPVFESPADASAYAFKVLDSIQSSPVTVVQGNETKLLWNAVGRPGQLNYFYNLYRGLAVKGGMLTRYNNDTLTADIHKMVREGLRVQPEAVSKSGNREVKGLLNPTPQEIEEREKAKGTPPKPESPTPTPTPEGTESEKKLTLAKIEKFLREIKSSFAPERHNELITHCAELMNLADENDNINILREVLRDLGREYVFTLTHNLGTSLKVNPVDAIQELFNVAADVYRKLSPDIPIASNKEQAGISKKETSIESIDISQINQDLWEGLIAISNKDYSGNLNEGVARILPHVRALELLGREQDIRDKLNALSENSLNFLLKQCDADYSILNGRLSEEARQQLGDLFQILVDYGGERKTFGQKLKGIFAKKPESSQGVELTPEEQNKAVEIRQSERRMRLALYQLFKRDMPVLGERKTKLDMFFEVIGGYLDEATVARTLNIPSSAREGRTQVGSEWQMELLPISIERDFQLFNSEFLNVCKLQVKPADSNGEFLRRALVHSGVPEEEVQGHLFEFALQAGQFRYFAQEDGENIAAGTALATMRILESGLFDENKNELRAQLKAWQEKQNKLNKQDSAGGDTGGGSGGSGSTPPPPPPPPPAFRSAQRRVVRNLSGESGKAGAKPEATKLTTPEAVVGTETASTDTADEGVRLNATEEDVEAVEDVEGHTAFAELLKLSRGLENLNIDRAKDQLAHVSIETLQRELPRIRKNSEKLNLILLGRLVGDSVFVQAVRSNFKREGGFRDTVGQLEYVVHSYTALTRPNEQLQQVYADEVIAVCWDLSREGNLDDILIGSEGEYSPVVRLVRGFNGKNRFLKRAGLDGLPLRFSIYLEDPKKVENDKLPTEAGKNVTTAVGYKPIAPAFREWPKEHCKRCGFNNPEGFQNCQKCRNKLTTETKTDVVQLFPPASPDQSAKQTGFKNRLRAVAERVKGALEGGRDERSKLERGISLRLRNAEVKMDKFLKEWKQGNKYDFHIVDMVKELEIAELLSAFDEIKRNPNSFVEGSDSICIFNVLQDHPDIEEALEKLAKIDMNDHQTDFHQALQEGAEAVSRFKTLFIQERIKLDAGSKN